MKGFIELQDGDDDDTSYILNTDKITLITAFDDDECVFVHYMNGDSSSTIRAKGDLKSISLLIAKAQK